MNKIWILTEEYNEYDQYGAYFLAWWPNKPTEDQLMAVGVDKHRTAHVLAGGGRVVGPGKYYDHQWYHLEEVSAG